MRPWAKVLLLGAILTASGMASSSALARSAGLCLECHSSSYLQSLKGSSPVWDRSVYQVRLEACPGIRSLSEEVFFTESRIVKINEVLKVLEQEGWATEGLKKKTSQTAESFFQLKNREITAVGQFARDSSALRSALQKVYDQTIQARAEWSHRWLIGVGVLLFIGVMVLLGVGFQKLNRMGKGLLLFLLIGEGLSFISCSASPVEPARKSPAQEQLDQLLSVATQTSSSVEESFYCSILLAQMAGEWSQIDPMGSDQAFQLAWKMALKSQEETGKLRSIQEVVSRWPDRTEADKNKVNFDTVLDLRDQVRNTEGRTWALRAVAEEWVRANEKKGRPALESASQKTQGIKDPEIRDRDLKSIAEAWGAIDENRALEISRSIADPFLRSLTLANLAHSTRNQDRAGNLIREAWKTAQSISSPQLQSYAFARVSAVGAKILHRERKFWADQVTAQLQMLKNPALQNVALQEAIFEWAPVDGEEAERWAGAIPAEFSEGRAYSFLLLSQRPGIPRAQAIVLLKKALTETERVTDSFESQRIKSLVGKELAKVDPQEALRLLSQIQDPFYRSDILRHLAEEFSQRDRKKALELAERIPLESLRTQTVLRVIGRGMELDRERVYSLYQEALQAAQFLPDPYARALNLIELGKAWGRLEKGRETFPFDLALKFADPISSPSSKAEILEILAEAWKNSDPVKGQAILERIDPSVVTVRKSLGEIRLWAKTDPLRVQQWADAIPPAFPYEKAMALKKVAVSLKKSQPQAALGVLEKALEQALTLPEGPRQTKLLSELIAESASLEKEWTLTKLRQLPDRQIRDVLFKEAGTLWAGEDPLQALKAAREITEGSLRLALYQKVAEGAARKLNSGKTEEAKPPLLSALIAWGQGREKTKREELQAVPFFERALEEIGKVKDPLEKSCLLSALAAEWAPLDEQKALKVAEKIPSKEFSEPFSYALLQVGSQYMKWNRREAEAVFQRSLLETGTLGDTSLRAQRFLQLAQQWRVINQEKGKEALIRAEKEARSVNPSGKGTPILAQILQTEVSWEPENSLAISRNAGSTSLQSKVLLEGARVLQGKSLEEDLKALEKALQLAQKEKNFRLMGEVAVTWYSLSPQKGLEILGQIEAKEIRVSALRRMARPDGSKPGGEARRLLDRATDEAIAVEGPTQKIQLLKEIGHDWAGMDKERAKTTYLKAYQILKREYLTSPNF